MVTTQRTIHVAEKKTIGNTIHGKYMKYVLKWLFEHIFEFFFMYPLLINVVAQSPSFFKALAPLNNPLYILPTWVACTGGRGTLI